MSFLHKISKFSSVKTQCSALMSAPLQLRQRIVDKVVCQLRLSSVRISSSEVLDLLCGAQCRVSNWCGGHFRLDYSIGSQLPCNLYRTLNLATKVKILKEIQRGNMFQTNNAVFVLLV